MYQPTLFEQQQAQAQTRTSRVHKGTLDDGTVIEVTYEQARQRIDQMMENRNAVAAIQMYREAWGSTASDDIEMVDHVWKSYANELFVLEAVCMAHDAQYEPILAT